MKFYNEKGFSLIQVMVAAALLGGLSLVFINLVKNMSDAQSTFEAKSDEIELERSIRLILNNPKHCRLSLAGNGPEGTPSSPEIFKKVNVDELNNSAEGKNVELYLGNIDGLQRGIKKFSATDSGYKKLGKVAIKTMKLYMTNNVGSSYPLNQEFDDVGTIRVVVEKKTKKNKTREIFLNFDLNLKLRNNTSGDTTILSCVTRAQITAKEVAEVIEPFRIPLYLDSVGSLTPNQTYTTTDKTCSRCRRSCAPAACPAGYSRGAVSCNLGGNCGFNRWRNCRVTCSKANSPVTYAIDPTFFN